MHYKNIRYEYFKLFLNDIIFKKKKGIYKYILVYNLPGDYSPLEKKVLKSFLHSSGFTSTEIETKVLKQYLNSEKLRNSNLTIPLFGNVLIAINKDNSFKLDFKNMEELNILYPIAIINNDGHVFYGSFLKNLNSMKIELLMPKLKNNIKTSIVRLRQVLSYCKPN